MGLLWFLKDLCLTGSNQVLDRKFELSFLQVAYHENLDVQDSILMQEIIKRAQYGLRQILRMDNDRYFLGYKLTLIEPEVSVHSATHVSLLETNGKKDKRKGEFVLNFSSPSSFSSQHSATANSLRLRLAAMFAVLLLLKLVE